MSTGGAPTSREDITRARTAEPLPDCDPDEGELHAVAADEPDHFTPLGAERHAHGQISNVRSDTAKLSRHRSDPASNSARTASRDERCAESSLCGGRPHQGLQRHHARHGALGSIARAAARIELLSERDRCRRKCATRTTCSREEIAARSGLCVREVHRRFRIVRKAALAESGATPITVTHPDESLPERRKRAQEGSSLPDELRGTTDSQC